MKTWIKARWAKLKLWVYGLLVALGAIAVPMALAVPVDWSWTNPTQNTDGSSFDASTEQAEVRLYCSIPPSGFIAETPGNPQSATTTAVSPLDATSLTVDLAPGTWDCFATVFDIYGYESAPSNISTKVVDRFPPNPPVLDN